MFEGLKKIYESSYNIDEQNLIETRSKEIIVGTVAKAEVVYVAGR